MFFLKIKKSCLVFLMSQEMNKNIAPLISVRFQESQGHHRARSQTTDIQLILYV